MKALLEALAFMIFYGLMGEENETQIKETLYSGSKKITLLLSFSFVIDFPSFDLFDN
jgi:hypothetical protein